MKKKYANNPKAAEARIYELSRKITDMREEVQELAEVLRESKESFEWTLTGLMPSKSANEYDPFEFNPVTKQFN
jgi:hypothetical protein